MLISRSEGGALLRVIDVSAGARAAWVDRSDPLCVFVDIRPEAEPDVVADSRALPFADGVFDLGVFDPPHTGFSGSRAMGAAYGKLACADIPDLVRGTARELARVLRAGALLTFKWNDHTWTLGSAVGWLAPWWAPMFGQVATARRTGGASQTSWIVLRRPGDGEAVLSLRAPGRGARLRALRRSLPVAA